ncbi:hypothetical protein [Rhodanobacter aciditrophus]|uniref:hypothetical protein n=1 Tax=Rhodanobacter aciditrophus TaxID=1623218 RepID=UPI003CFB4EA4
MHLNLAHSPQIHRHFPWNPACRDAGRPAGDPQQITSPLRAGTYAMRLHQHRPPTPIASSATADAGALYWFVDDAYAGQGSPGTSLFWQPRSAGSYRVRVVDDHGRGDERLL